MTKKLKYLIKDLILFSKAEKEEYQEAYNYVVKELQKEIIKDNAKPITKIFKELENN